MLDVTPGPRLSTVAATLELSGILRIGAEVEARRAAGHAVCDLAMGDFSPREFPIPTALAEGIAAAVRAGETSYPAPPGMPALRESVAALYRERLGIPTGAANVLVVSGVRPALYGAFRALVDPGERVVFGVPTWHMPDYCRLVGAEPAPVPCGPGTGFLPTAAALEPALAGARLLCLNSPHNPAGTAFAAADLADICDVVLAENARRQAAGARPLFVLYDQVYWSLVHGGAEHVSPPELRPAMADWTVMADGVSKHFAATGLRVGWAVGPADVVRAMGVILAHAGAWAPRPEQVATAALLARQDRVAAFGARMREALGARLEVLHGGLRRLAEEGLPVHALRPAGAMYVSARFDLLGRDVGGRALGSDEDVRAWLLEEAGVAAIPFGVFGVEHDSGWFRLAVGGVSPGELEEALARLAAALRAIG